MTSTLPPRTDAPETAHPLTTAAAASTAVSTPLPLRDVVVDDAFWSPRIDQVRLRTIPVQRAQLERVGHLRALAGAPAPEDGVPHVFWDSDVAKWIEAASNSLATHPDPALDADVDAVIELLAAAQQPDGYLNTHFTTVAPEQRYTDLRDAHELYCAGHLIEAGVAHHAATGKTSLLDVVVRLADHIGTVFGRGPGQLRGYDGHEEVELALVKLARATGERRHLELASYFVEERGQEPYFFDAEAERRGTPGWFGEHFAGLDHPGRTREYLQAHAPVREQHEAVGHSVRAMYLYSAMADLALEDADDSLLQACQRLWCHLLSTRTYVTGGIGSTVVNEGFTRDYDLPTETAYAETCAAIGLVMWAQRMLRIDRDRRYGDVMELALHNAVLAGISEDGERFFYDNVLASRGGVERHEWFEVACCPPNIARLLTSLGTYAFAQAPDELLVHLHLGGSVVFETSAGQAAVDVTTTAPWGGRTTLVVTQATGAPFTLSVRVPAWASSTAVTVDGAPLEAAEHVGEDGYLSVTRTWRVGDELDLQLGVQTRRLWADPRVTSEAGHVVLTRGPFVYAAEEADNRAPLVDLRVGRRAEPRPVEVPGLPGVVGLQMRGERVVREGSGLYQDEPPHRVPTDLTLVPYYAWANRGPGEMRVWLGDAER
ncbi:glycoside hydrolase family 127 protein [Quadrisphaera oryzae]|uniref:glycoside hydrolase family 127 protein n=1 Tax=Quadrisphaera TaxID=317661 RepID=UPI0016440523|nr:beta-L-arabinofuranosidase domain-containing protein [Quadrisphaera sp. RL12-1S]MBC3762685.1 glycoside hydrolase family 127 protein [Quadrisphaera sp. RL12-1S]